MKTHEDKIKEIVAYYGYEAQSRQLIEEMAELTQAVNKLWRINKGYKLADSTTKKMYFDNVIEEIADVEVCLSYGELLRFIEVGASCFNHYCIGYDIT